MKAIQIVIYATIVSLLYACDSSTHYSKSHTLPQGIWAEALLFEPTIENTNQKYTCTIAIRHLSAIRIVELPLKIEIKSPSGKSETHLFHFPFRNEKGELIGEAIGDICDTQMQLDKALNFKEKGTYQISLSPNAEGANQIGGIVDLHLKIKMQD